MAKAIVRVHWGVDEGVYTDFEGMSVEKAMADAARFLEGYARNEGWIELDDDSRFQFIDIPMIRERKSPFELAMDEAMVGMRPTSIYA